MSFFHPKVCLMLDQGRFADAEVAIRAELAESIEDAYLYYLLGVSLLGQEKPKEAEKAAREAISFGPEMDLGYLGLSRALLEQKKKKEALEAIHEAIRLDPDCADHHAHAAQIYHAMRKWDQALESTDAGLALDPDNEGCRFFRGLLLERMGRRDESDDVSLGLLSDDPDDAQNHNARGWILIERGDPEGAERHFIEALRIYPDYEDAREGLAFAFKMRSPILGSVLKLLVALDRIPVGWALLGLFAILEVSGRVMDSDLPAPIPQLGNIFRLLLYALLVLMVLIHPLFNLILATKSTTRHALTDQARRGVKWYVGPVVLSFLFLGLWLVAFSGKFLPVHSIAWASLARVCFEVFESENVWVLRRMAVVAVLCLCFVVAIQVYAYGFYIPELAEIMRSGFTDLADQSEEARKAFVGQLLEHMRKGRIFVQYPILALWIASSFSDNLREFFVRRSPD